MTDYEIIRNTYIRAALKEQERLPSLPEPEAPVQGKRMTEEQYRLKHIIGAYVLTIGMPLLCMIFGN